MLRRLRAGGEDADEALCEVLLMIRKPLIGFLCKRGATVDQAENIVQDTFLKAREKIQSFQGNSKFTSWLYVIALNLLRDEQRRESRWGDGQDIDDDTQLPEASRTPSTESVVQTRRLEKCLDEHYPKFRADHPDRAEELDQMVTMGWGPKELAEHLGEPGATIRKRLERHRNILRDYLAPCADDYKGRVL